MKKEDKETNQAMMGKLFDTVKAVVGLPSFDPATFEFPLACKSFVLQNLKEVKAKSVWENFEKPSHHSGGLENARKETTAIKKQLDECRPALSVDFTNLVHISSADLEARLRALGFESKRIQNELLKRQLKLNILSNNMIIEKCDELLPKVVKLMRSESETEGDEKASKQLKRGNCFFCFDFFFVC